MVYIIIGKCKNYYEIVAAVGGNGCVVICDFFSEFSEGIRHIKKYLKEAEEKNCVLVHDETSSVPIGEAVYLLERCGADKVFDWCYSANWQSYIEEASNAPLLNEVDGYYLTELGRSHLETAYNPFSSVLFGTETEGNWNGRLYSTHIRRESISLRKIIRKALVKYISVTCGRSCTEKDYDDFKKAFNIRFGSIGEELQTGVPIRSFYEDDLQWESVFSKRSTLNIGKTIKQRLGLLQRDIEQKTYTVKAVYRDVLQKAAVHYTEQSGYGIRFAYELFSMFLMPEIKTLLDMVAEQCKQTNNAEKKFRQEADESAYAASRASRFSGNREIAMEEYVDALEAYWGCLVRQVKLQALYDIYEEIKGIVSLSAKGIEHIMQKRESFAAEYGIDFDDDTLAIFQITLPDVKTIDECLADEKYDELEKMLRDKYAQDIVNIIKIRERNSNVKLIDDDIVWITTEEVSLFNRMTDDFSINVKTGKEKDDVYRKWVWQYFDEGVLRKADDGFAVLSHGLYKELDKVSLSLVELLELHRQLEQDILPKAMTVIPIIGTTDILVKYLQNHTEWIATLDEQSEINNRNRLIREQCRKELYNYI